MLWSITHESASAGLRETFKQAVGAGLGMGLLSTHTVAAERRAGLLVDLPMTGWKCNRARSRLQENERISLAAGEGVVATWLFEIR